VGYPPLSPRPLAIQYRKRIIEPLGQAMNDYLIYAKLAERLGYGHLYPQTEEEMVRYVIADLPFTFEEFKNQSQEGPISLEDPAKAPTLGIKGEEKKWLSGKLRPDGKPGFPGPSGKWEIASSTLDSLGFNPLPTYDGVKEGPGNKDLVRDYPLTLTTGTRIQSTFRSQHLNIPGLLKRQACAEALIHPNDAKERNISHGDAVRVKTIRGEVQFSARVTEDILEGVVEVNMGGGSPIQGEGWRESNVNFLTDEENVDPISGFPVLKALLCEVEKI
jgi:anaerobic selenocysteine-containing dehydrogenase